MSFRVEKFEGLLEALVALQGAGSRGGYDPATLAALPDVRVEARKLEELTLEWGPVQSFRVPARDLLLGNGNLRSETRTAGAGNARRFVAAFPDDAASKVVGAALAAVVNGEALAGLADEAQGQTPTAIFEMVAEKVAREGDVGIDGSTKSIENRTAKKHLI